MISVVLASAKHDKGVKYGCQGVTVLLLRQSEWLLHLLDDVLSG